METVLGYSLKLFSREDEESLYEIFREVVESGSQFPYESSSKQEFYKQFLNEFSHFYVCHSSDKEVVGGFYLRANFPGKTNYIANAAYMVKNSCRGHGIGTFLIKASLRLAKDLGFQAMQFNSVFSQNTIAVGLYQKLGFDIVETKSKSVRNPDGTYQDSYVMYRKLEK